MPTVSPPKGLTAIRLTFGSFSFKPMSPPSVDIDDTWENDNLVRVRNVCNTGLDIRLHRKVVDVFEESLEAAIKAAPTYKVRMLGGYCPRQMKTLDPAKQATAPLSTHSWGIAFDINWDKNPFSHTLVTDLPTPFIVEFTSRGWEWGGDWKSSKDSMHFQFCTGY